MTNYYIGIDLATNTGIVCLKKEGEHVIKVICSKVVKVYDKNNMKWTCRTINSLINSIKMLIYRDCCDQTIQLKIGIELTHYSYKAGMLFNRLIGMFEQSIYYIFKDFLVEIKEIEANEWHKKVLNTYTNDNIKRLSIEYANQTLINNCYNYFKIEDDNIADAFNIAYNYDILDSTQQKHNEVVNKRKAIKNKEHKLNLLRKRLNLWNEKQLKKHSKTNLKKINEIKQKIEEIEYGS